MSELINANSIEYMKTLKDESIDLIVTDPPYRVTSHGVPSSMGGMLKTKLSRQGKIFKYNDVRPIDYIPQFYRLLKDGSHCYIMSNHVNLQEMLNVSTKCGFKFIKSIIWNKGNKIASRFYMNQFEYILFFRKGKGIKINNCGTSDIISIPNKKLKDENNKNIHDTEKPVELMKILVENSSKENEIVLDPFMGIGSVCIACKELNREYIGIELDENYYNIVLNRIK